MGGAVHRTGAVAADQRRNPPPIVTIEESVGTRIAARKGDEKGDHASAWSGSEARRAIGGSGPLRIIPDLIAGDEA